MIFERFAIDLFSPISAPMDFLENKIVENIYGLHYRQSLFVYGVGKRLKITTLKAAINK